MQKQFMATRINLVKMINGIDPESVRA